MTNLQIAQLHATTIKMMLKNGIHSKRDEQSLCYYINKLEECFELQHPAYATSTLNPFKDLLEEADDALVTWANCQSHIELPVVNDRNPCSGCSSLCWGC